MTPHSKLCYLHNPETTWCPTILENQFLWLIIAYTWSPKRMEQQCQHNNRWLACTEHADLHTTNDLHALSVQTCMHWACIWALIKCSDVIISCNDPPFWMWANQFWVLIDVAPPMTLCWPMSDYQKDSTSRTPLTSARCLLCLWNCASSFSWRSASRCKLDLSSVISAACK